MKNFMPFLALIWVFTTYVFAAEENPDFRAIAQTITNTIRTNHFHPAVLDEAPYLLIEAKIMELGKSAESMEGFLSEFREIWRNPPFSHVFLFPASRSASESIAQFDEMIVDERAFDLSWQGSTAILRLNIMSGANTISFINAAFEEINEKNAERLIIDLRENGGGAFAVVPLIGHLINQPKDIGVFVSSNWYNKNSVPPDTDDFLAASPWTGDSIGEFYEFMLDRELTGYRIEPMEPVFSGQVQVLISNQTISAAEIAADALKQSGRAKLIGERTRGAVLSSKQFDIPGGLQLVMPVADYVSIENGRLEQSGVTPDISVPPEKALETALNL